MKLLLLVTLTFSYLTNYSQTENIYNRKPWEEVEKKYKAELEKKLLENKMIESKQKDGSMPVLKPKLTAKYLGSNGKGADIYAMMPYNMPCLVPDSTFKSNMPVMLKDKTQKVIVKE
jgi:hypothetical protein